MEKISLLNSLIKQVVKNTHQESDGYRADVAKEKKYVKEILKHLLQRNPTIDEINKALSPF